MMTLTKPSRYHNPPPRDVVSHAKTCLQTPARLPYAGPRNGRSGDRGSGCGERPRVSDGGKGLRYRRIGSVRGRMGAVGREQGGRGVETGSRESRGLWQQVFASSWRH